MSGRGLQALIRSTSRKAFTGLVLMACGVAIGLGEESKRELPIEPQRISLRDDLHIAAVPWSSVLLQFEVDSGDPESGDTPTLGSGRTIRIALGDLDEDGVDDLIRGYRAEEGNFLVWQAGISGGPAPEDTAVAPDPGTPFRRRGEAVRVPVIPQFVHLGDFDGDGHPDLLFAERGGSELHFLAGQGSGKLAARDPLSLPGSLETLLVADVNRSDGLPDIVLALEGDEGHELWILEGLKGALRSQPERHSLPGPARELAAGDFNGDHFTDLAVAAGRQVVLIEGRDRMLAAERSTREAVPSACIHSLEFAERVQSVAAGDFLPGRSAALAVLTDDSRVRLYGTDVEGDAEGEVAAEASTGESQAWKLLLPPVSLGGSELRTTSLTFQTGRELLVIDSANLSISVLRFRPDGASRAWITPPIGSIGQLMTTRLSRDSRDELVLLDSLQGTVNILGTSLCQSAPVFIVNDSGSQHGTTNGVCDADNDSENGLQCTLGEAIREGNASEAPFRVQFSPSISVATPGSGAAVQEPACIDGEGRVSLAGNLTINSDGSVVQGLILRDDVSLTSNGDNIWIRANSGEGLLRVSGEHTQVGGASAEDRNTFSMVSVLKPFSAPRKLEGIVIEGNYIGTDGPGEEALVARRDASARLSLSETNGALILDNLIGGSTQVNLNLFGTEGTRIQGNRIGTNAGGNRSLLVEQNIGIAIGSGQDDMIGGAAEGQGNLISGHSGGFVSSVRPDGSAIQLSNDSGTLVLGNRIGTDDEAQASVGNVKGIFVEGQLDTEEPKPIVIGAAENAAPNIISGNLREGISLVERIEDRSQSAQGSGSNPPEVQILGNRIGLAGSGDEAIPNQREGIRFVFDVDDVLIAGNQISHNGSHGILFDLGAETTRARIVSNSISSNGGDGVYLGSTKVMGVSIQENSIHDNAQLGIDLRNDGITPNDDGDGDQGANGLQNFPELESFDGQVVTGTLSGPAPSYQIEFFENLACDDSATDSSGMPHGEGMTFLHSESTGAGTFNITLPAGTLNPISATATDSMGNTSEFSNCLLPTGIESPATFIVNSNVDGGDSQACDGVCSTSDGSCTLRAAIQESNCSFSRDTIQFDDALRGVPIDVTASLTITAPLEIDARTQSPAAQVSQPAGGPGAILVRGPNQRSDVLEVKSDVTILDLSMTQFLTAIVVRPTGSVYVEGSSFSYGKLGISIKAGSHGNEIGGVADPANCAAPCNSFLDLVFGIENLGTDSLIQGNHFSYSGDFEGFTWGIWETPPAEGSTIIGNLFLGSGAGIDSRAPHALIEDNRVEIGEGNRISGSAFRVSGQGTQVVDNRIVGSIYGIVIGVVDSSMVSGQDIVLTGNVVGNPPGQEPGGLAAIQVFGQGHRIGGSNPSDRNFIGIDSDGTTPLNAFETGIRVTGARDVEIQNNMIILSHTPFSKQSEIRIECQEGGPDSRRLLDYPNGCSSDVRVFSNVTSGPAVLRDAFGYPVEGQLPTARDADQFPNGGQAEPLIREAQLKPGGFSSDCQRDFGEPILSVRVIAKGAPGETVELEILTGGSERLFEPVSRREMTFPVKGDQNWSDGTERIFLLAPQVEPGSSAYATLTSSFGTSSFDIEKPPTILLDTDGDGLPDVLEMGDEDGNQVRDFCESSFIPLTASNGGKVPVTVSARMASVNFEALLDLWETEADFPVDALRLILEGLEKSAPAGLNGVVAGTATVRLGLPEGLTIDSYYNYGPTPENQQPHFYEFLFDGQTGAEILENEIVLHFVDGQRGDHDLTVNDRIETLGGPVAMATTLYFPLNVTSPESFVGVAVSNFGQTTALLEFDSLEPSGLLQEAFNNPAVVPLEPATQLADLNNEIFDLPANSEDLGWIRLKSSSPDIGSFFQIGTGIGLDGSVALEQKAAELTFSRVFEGEGSYRGRESSTRLAIANPNPREVEIELSLDGVEPGASPAGVRLPVGAVASRILPPLGASSGRLSEIFGPLVVESGTVTVRSKECADPEECGVVGFQSIELDDPGTIIGLNASSGADSESTVLYSAQLASVPDLFFTSIKLINQSAQARTLQVRAIAEDGSELATPVAVNLLPGETLESDIDQILDFGGEAAVGSLEITADDPGVFGDVLFGNPNGQTAAALPLQAVTFRDAIFSQAASIPGFFTGLALFNPGETTAQVSLEVFSSGGELVGEVDVELGPQERLSRTLGQLVPASVGLTSGYIRLHADRGIVAQQLFGDSATSFLSAVPPRVIQ